MKFTKSPRRARASAISRRQALREIGGAAGAVALAPLIAGCGGDDDGRAAAPTPTASPSPTTTATPTAGAAPSPSATATASATATSPPAPTATQTATETLPPTETPTPSPTATATVIPPLLPEELDIETVVIVMMENRSFDHYLGALKLEGRAVDGLDAGFFNPRVDGSPAQVFPMDLRCVADPPHGWTSSRAQINGGANDGFVREHHRSVVSDGLPPEVADQAMGYHGRSHLPFFYGLADEFALCERWFCSVLGPTWPNRMYLHSAQSNGRMNNAFPEDPVNGFTWPTIYDRLTEAGIEWRSYYSDLAFLFLWPRFPQRPIPPFATIETFVDDARSGRLPPVCSVEPTYFGAAANDDHPPHDFQRGQAFLSTVLRAIAEGPQWSRSLVLITYDEHGGFFDHVAPPMVADERSAEGFGQLGVRVPGLVISPWTKRGFVSSALYEHSSWPALLEWLFGLEPLTVRDAQAEFFLDTFDLDRIRRNDPRPFPKLPLVDVEPDVPPECGGPEATGQGTELAQFADAGRVPSHLDRRRDSARILQTLNRELIRLGGARPIPRRRRAY